jgi:hypothetical protein
VSARRFTELSVVSDDLEAPRQVESISRSPGSVELHSVDRRAASGEE